MEYLQLFAALFTHKVKYLICGGLAVNIYGIPRMTADIDLLLCFKDWNLERFNKVVEELSFKSHVPISINALLDETTRSNMVKDKNMIAYSYYNDKANYMNLDVLIDTPIDFEKLWDERESRKVEDFEIQMVSIENLITMKKYANRSQDQQDIVLLSKLKDIK